MADRGQITGGELDGPLAFDNAISPEAARIKGIKSTVAGRAQILVVPDLEAGNMLAKNLSFLSRADAAGIVLGARVPIILTSRADNCPDAHGVVRRGHASRAQAKGEGAHPGLSDERKPSSCSTPVRRHDVMTNSAKAIKRIAPRQAARGWPLGVLCTDMGSSERRDLPSKNAPCSITNDMWRTSGTRQYVASGRRLERVRLRY